MAHQPIALDDFGALAVSLGITLAKVAGFVVLMLIVGRRAIPMLLHYIAHTGSRELFRLAVLSVALGVAFIASELFGVLQALDAKTGEKLWEHDFQESTWASPYYVDGRIFQGTDGNAVYVYGLIEYVASVDVMVKLGDVVCARFGP